ncbi:MAG: metallophosphoesterase [Burkholderiales bacterium]|nr:metallophosphoesterase [Burkholderiales bacterium]
MKTLVHLSDLHFGRTDAAVVAALAPLVQSLQPDVVVVSGDLTQRAKPDEFRQARSFLDGLPRPQIVVPGNHDVPLYNVFQRFVQPLDKYRRFITDDLEPFYADSEIAVAGINTARSLTFKDGRINGEQMQALRARFTPLAESMTKIVVTHHPFDLPAGNDDDEVVGRAEKAMEVFRRSGADILLSGHLHVSNTSSSGGRYKLDGYAALIIQAGTATSTRERGEANSFNQLVIDGDTVHIDRWVWDAAAGRFAVGHSETFRHTGTAWELQGG